MKAQKLPSGNYRIQKTINGKVRSFTFDHKPTQKEINERISKVQVRTTEITFEQAAKEYCESKRNVLSPASMREYDRMCSRLPNWFVIMNINDIDQYVLQKLVNEMAKDLSPKTVKDRHAFCVAVIRLFRPSMVFYTTLPKKAENEPYIPTHEDVKRLIDASVGTQYHIPLQLAAYGLRREEICALDVSDIEQDKNGYLLTINKALVQDTEKNWVIKGTKTIDSARAIYIDEALAKEILSIGSGRVFTGFPETIATFLARTQKALGMERFSLHKLRHYFCTTLAEAGVPEADILKMGGWKKGSSVMKLIYRHSTIEREKERLASASNVLIQKRS